MKKHSIFFLFAIFFVLGVFLLTGCELPKLVDYQEPSQEPVNLEEIVGDLPDSGDFEIFELTPEDCFPEETYDPVEKTCYFECEGKECDTLEQKIQEQLDAFIEAYNDEEGEVFKELDPTLIQPETEGTYEGQDGRQPSSEPSQSGEEKALASYSVEGNNITIKTGEDKKEYQEIWNYFASLFPENYRSFVAVFEIFSDGREGTMAAVAQVPEDPNKWMLAIDPEDAYKDGQVDKEEITYSLIHEFGHLLTLSSKQVPPDTKLFYVSGDQEYKTQLEDSINSCRPRFFTGEGCSNKDSYINLFVEKYWADIFHEHKAIEEIESDQEYELKMGEFYQKYQDRFVSDYAATNPGEDIAESFTVFILKEKPIGETIADRKVKYFYDFPELVDLRSKIRTKIR